jgi:hypothetical protein
MILIFVCRLRSARRLRSLRCSASREMCISTVERIRFAHAVKTIVCRPVAELEAILTKAGIALPDKAAYVNDDGTPNNSAYGQALYDQLLDLQKTQTASDLSSLSTCSEIE